MRLLFRQKISAPSIRRREVVTTKGKTKVVYDLQYRVYDTSGKIYRKHSTFKSKKEALDEYNVVSAAVGGNNFGDDFSAQYQLDPGGYTLSDYIEKFRDLTAHSQSKSTHYTDGIFCKTLTKFFNGTTPIKK